MVVHPFLGEHITAIIRGLLVERERGRGWEGGLGGREGGGERVRERESERERERERERVSERERDRESQHLTDIVCTL